MDIGDAEKQMKAKNSYSSLVAKGSARGAMGMFGAIGVFLTVFIIWSFTCFGGALLALVKKYI